MNVFLCVLFHDDDSLSYFLPVLRSHVLTFVTAHPFFAPPLRCLTFAYILTHTNIHSTWIARTHARACIISITMVTLSKAPLLPERASPFKPSFVLLQRWGRARRRADVRRCVCVSSEAVHECVCTVWVNVCVTGWATGLRHRNAGQDVGRKFQKEQNKPKTHPEVPLTVS